MTSAETLGFTFDFAGKVLLGVMTLLVHRRVRLSHKIGKKVLKEMKNEMLIGLLAILLIIVGYIFHLL